MRGSSASVMCGGRCCGAVALPLLLLLLRARVACPLPADERLDEPLDERDAFEAEAALDQVVDSIRERVMRELGLTHAPVKNATDAEIEEVMKEYRRLQAEQRRQEDYEAEMEEPSSFGSYHSIVDEGWPRSRAAPGLRLPTSASPAVSAYFPLSAAGLGAHEYVVDGTLCLYLQHAAGAGARFVQLTLYEVAAPTAADQRPRRLRRARHLAHVNASGWHEFNVSSLAQRWRARPEDNHGVQVECRRCQGAVRLVAGGVSRELAPRLTLRTKTVRRTKRAGHPVGRSASGPRPRRGGPLDCAGGPRKKCCRQKMEVNFKELGGFDFIIQPEVFSAYYCRGRCPPSYNVASDHALLQGWIHQKRKRGGGGGGRHVPRTCCVPSKLSPLTIVHLDREGRPKLTYWENVVADECKCS